jgi:phage terminase large subunit
MQKLKVKTPRWFVPYYQPRKFKGLKGGRASGKSHAFAELAVVTLIRDPNKSIVCIREIQKSLKFSAKRVIEGKIQSLGVGHLFEVLETEIRCTSGKGIIIFQGMQDHTAESIKSLEAFDVAWVEEAQSLSKRSVQLLIPTIIRKKHAEIWFSWNPNLPTDAVEVFFDEGQKSGSQDFLLSHINYIDNPFLDDTTLKLAEEWDKSTYAHVWLGDFNYKSDAQVLHGKWVVRDFEPEENWGIPYYGADWGFSVDPTTLVKCWVYQNILYIEREIYRVGLEIKDTAEAFKQIMDSPTRLIIADSARPETISHVKRDGLNIKPVDKWKGSVEDGIAFLRSFNQIIIHPRCKNVAREAMLYSYKEDRMTGLVTSDIIDADNHCIDAVRYALGNMIKRKNTGGFW